MESAPALKFRPYLLGILVCLMGCSPKISPFAGANRYLHNFSIHILNDSLQLHFVTPSDIKYLTVNRAVISDLKKNAIRPANPILLYGSTNTPSYAFLVTIGPRREKLGHSSIVLDSVVAGHNLHFIGATTVKNSLASMKADLYDIIKQIRSGAEYLKDTGSVMSVVNRSMGSNLFYQTLTEIRQYSIPQNQGNSLELQMQLTFASFLGSNPIYEELIRKLEKSFVGRDSITAVIRKSAVTDEVVLDSIVSAAN